MDVVSSVAGLVALADLVYGKVFWYIKAVKNAERDITTFSTEIRTLSGVLHSLHLVARQVEGEDYDHSIRVHHVYYCHETLEAIKNRLQKTFPHGDKASGGKALLTKLKWPFSAPEIKELIAEIQRHKSVLTLALSTDNLLCLLKALSRQSAMEKEVKEIKHELRKKWNHENRIALTAYHRQVLAFFSKVNPQSNHNINLKLRHPGTGLWYVSSYNCSCISGSTDIPDFDPIT